MQVVGGFNQVVLIQPNVKFTSKTMAIHNLVNVFREKKIESIPFTLWIEKERRFSKILLRTCILSLYEQGEFLTVKAKIFPVNKV